MAGPSPSPVRYPSGVSTDYPHQPFANYGLPDPADYHTWWDDFDGLNAIYTSTATTNGTTAAAAGNGGVLLMTTNSSTPVATDLNSIQLPAASFAFTLGKKAFYGVRCQVHDPTNVGLIAGLIQTTTTPFSVTDGLFFYKAPAAANNLVLRSTAASATTDLTVPTAAYTLAVDTNIDMAWYVDRSGNVMAFVGSQLFGWLPQSGTGSTTPARGAVASFAPTLSTANLNFTFAIRSGTTASTTAKLDFAMAAIER